MADGSAEHAGGRDEFVAAHQGGHAHPGDHRPGPLVQDAQQQAGGASAGVGEIDVGIGVVQDQAIAVLQHGRGEDAVQVQGEDDGHVGAENLAGFPEQESFGIEFPGGCHGAVHAEVEPINAGGVPAQGVEKFVGDGCEAFVGQGAGRGGAGPAGGHEFDVGALREDLEGAANFRLYALVIPEQLFAAVHGEAVAGADDRVERGDFLLALGDEDFRHGRGPLVWIGPGLKAEWKGS